MPPRSDFGGATSLPNRHHSGDSGADLAFAFALAVAAALPFALTLASASALACARPAISKPVDWAMTRLSW